MCAGVRIRSAIYHDTFECKRNCTYIHTYLYTYIYVRKAFTQVWILTVCFMFPFSLSLSRTLSLSICLGTGWLLRMFAWCIYLGSVALSWLSIAQSNSELNEWSFDCDLVWKSDYLEHTYTHTHSRTNHRTSRHSLIVFCVRRVC